MSERKYDLEDRIIEFSAKIVHLVDSLPASRAGNYIGGQLIRCGIAPSLMYGEAQGAESRDDFIHKMKLALKELKETRSSQKLIRTIGMVPLSESLNELYKENEQLIAIIGKSIETAKTNNQKERK
jgi:four helix bundle protein